MSNCLPSRDASSSQSYTSAHSNVARVPVFSARARAEETASSLRSTPVTVAPSLARLIESPPELHWRWTRDVPSSLPRRSRSSWKSVLPPSLKNLERSPRWLLWAPITAFHDTRFCSRRSLRSIDGFYLRHDFPVSATVLRTCSKSVTVCSQRSRREARRVAAADILTLSMGSLKIRAVSPSRTGTPIQDAIGVFDASAEDQI